MNTLPDQRLGVQSGRSRGRILAITSSFPRWPGDTSGPFVLNLAQDLDAYGWQVDVLAPHGPGAAAREEMGGVSVERFRYLWPSVLETLCYGGGMLANLRRDRFNLLKVPPLVLAEWVALMRRLAQRRYDLVHTHWLVPQGLVATLAAPIFRIPHVTTVHGSDVLALRSGPVTAINRTIVRRANAVTVNSAATRAAVESMAPGARCVRQIPMGITTTRVPDRAAVARIRGRYRRGGGPLLVFVGRVVWEKGVGDLVEALSVLASRCRNVTAMIVGDGPDRPAFERLATEHGVADRITFVGRVPPEHVLDYIGAADVFVGPSWIEAFGLVFAEALHAGTPVVGTTVGGISDCVVHEKTGLLVPPRAPEAIAAAVERFVMDPEFAQHMALAGQATVRESMSREAAARAFSHLFQSVISANEGRPLAQRETAVQ